MTVAYIFFLPDEMSESLLSCGDRAGDNSDLLLTEWRKLHPKSRALRAKLAALLKTKADAAPPKKKPKMEEEEQDSGNNSSLPPSPPEEVPDEFAPEKEEASAALEPEKEKKKECAHVMHLFPENGTSEERNCQLTESLMKLRAAAVPQFPGCDIYHVKKPRGKVQYER